MKTLAQTGLIAAIAMVAVFSSCKKDDCPEPTPPPAPAQSLYNQVGGTTMVADPNGPAGTMIEKGYLSIRSVVDSSILVIAADPTLQPSFAVLLGEVVGGNTTGLAMLSKNVTDFFAFNAGSANHIYEGMSMYDTHNSANPRMTGLATNPQMNAFIADVVTGAQQNNVPASVIGQFGTLMESLRTTIVQ